MADEATQGIDPTDLEKSLANSFDSLVAGRKPWPHWQYIVPVLTNRQQKQPYPGQMSVARPMEWFPALTRGPKSLRSTADANVSLSYPPFPALQLGTKWAACILFVHHMPPSENCHIQAHVLFTAWAQSAVPEVQESSTRSQSVRDRVGIPLKKRWFHSNGVREAPQHTARHSLQHVSICYKVRRWPTTTVHVWLRRPGHPGLQHPRWRLARGQPLWCTTLGGLQNK